MHTYFYLVDLKTSKDKLYFNYTVNPLLNIRMSTPHDKNLNYPTNKQNYCRHFKQGKDHEVKCKCNPS